MLHAFNSDTGTEEWAYIPKMVMPNLYKLADSSYPSNHQYYVDGSPETMDIYVATATPNLAVGWHTILVGGLGLGGRGFYALDVTNPDVPQALWEICSDSALCDISDTAIGYSYGNPVIVKRSTDQKWVVLLTSGYNNTAPGSGEGTLFVLDAVTGEVLSKTSTGTATNPPSGLAKISPFIDSLATDYTARFVYGGDLNGDVWRFDLGAVGASGAPTVTKIATLKDSSGVAQSVTTRLELGDPLNNTSNSLGGTGTPALFVGTGRYLGTTDLPNVQIQSIYGIKDDLSRTCAAASCYASPRAYNVASSDKFVRQYIYEASDTTRTTSTNAVSWSSNSGWYVDFMVSDSVTNAPVLPSPSPGERINLDPQLVSGSLLVVTNVPETSACTIGGSSWFYSFDYLNGQYVSTASDQVAGKKLGNALSVGFVVGRLPGGQIKGWVTGADGEKMKVDPDPKGTGSTRKTSWRELTVQ
jgi:type IV pilus assembly protein PilY1